MTATGTDSNTITGLEAARWGGGVRENSVMGALSFALGQTDTGASYAFLMGVSGAAFRFQLAQPDWCPSSPHAGCGFNCADQVTEALPFTCRAVGLPEDGEQRVERAREAVVASIDRGVPALYRHEEESLVVGYAEGGERVLLRGNHKHEAGYEEKPLAELLSSWAGMGVLEPGDAQSREAAIERSLELAVELADTPAFDRYASGFAAFERWIEDLRDEAAFEGEPQALFMKGLPNAHCFASLADARAAAVEYLREVAPELDAERAARARAAADIYAQEVELLCARPPYEVAPAPWHLQGKPWTQEKREAQAQLLEQALGLERKAVDALRTKR